MQRQKPLRPVLAPLSLLLGPLQRLLRANLMWLQSLCRLMLRTLLLPPLLLQPPPQLPP